MYMVWKVVETSGTGFLVLDRRLIGPDDQPSESRTIVLSIMLYIIKNYQSVPMLWMYTNRVDQKIQKPTKGAQHVHEMLLAGNLERKFIIQLIVCMYNLLLSLMVNLFSITSPSITFVFFQTFINFAPTCFSRMFRLYIYRGLCTCGVQQLY